MQRAVALIGVVLLVCLGGVASGRASMAVNGRLVFAKGSDLFTIRPDGSGLRRLTTGASADDEPAWSPDGRWIAFSRVATGPRKVTSVYVVAATGGAPRLVVRGGRSPSWSPSGRRLAVLRSGDTCYRSCPRARSVWTVPLAGGTPRLTSSGAWSSDWSPSGRELAVMRLTGIWIVEVASGKTRRLSNVRGRPGAMLDWSPDGQQLLLVANNNLIAVSRVDGSVTTLARPPPPISEGSQTCAGSLGRAVWSPDGRWIAHEEARCIRGDGTLSHSFTIPVITPDGAGGTEIDNANWGYNPGDLGTHSPVWSPDSRHLGYIDEAESSTGTAFLATATRSGNYRRLTRGVYSTPAWQQGLP